MGTPRSKGNAFETSLEFLRREHPSRVEPVLARLSPEARGTLTGVLVASAWYPFAHFAELTHALCEEVPGGFLTVARKWGAWAINRDFQGGIYKVFLRAASPRLIVRAYSRFWGLYHSTGAAAVLAEEERRVRVLVHGIHQPAKQVLYGTMAAAERLLELSGTPRVVSRVLAGAGLEDCYAEWEMSW